MKQYLLDYARYNLWCNQRLSDLFRQQSDALLQTPVVSSFPSIRETFVHLWAVEFLWLERLKGVSPKSFPSAENIPNSLIFDRLTAISKDIIAFIEAQEEAYFAAPLAFSLLASPEEMRQLPKDMLHHLFNHQTMHRGQLITMGRQLGITSFPRTDYIVWQREQG